VTSLSLLRQGRREPPYNSNFQVERGVFMKSLRLEITATEANYNDGGEVDVEDAIAALAESEANRGFTFGRLLRKLGKNSVYNDDRAEVTLRTGDQVWNKGTEDEAVTEPYEYTFTISRLDG